MAASLYNERRQRQFGVDAIATKTNGNHVVVSCKRYKHIRKGQLPGWSDDFLRYWDAHWKQVGVESFVLFLACEPRSRQRREEAEAEARRFLHFGVRYEVWGPREIVRRLRPLPSVANHFLGAHWAGTICGPLRSDGDGTRILNVPPRLQLFIGRERELDELALALMPGPGARTHDTPRRAALWGLGGLGKTSLASEFVHRSASAFAGVVWCSAGPGVLAEQLAAAGTALGLPTSPTLDAAARQTIEWVSRPGNGRWLVVYDGVEEPDAIRRLLPSGDASLLVTSRYRDWIGWAMPLAMAEWSRGESVEFLDARGNSRDRTGAELLATVLGDLPLAMEHAAAVSRRSGRSYAALAAQAERLIRVELRNVPTEHRSVYATFRIAIDEVVAGCPEVEEAMAFVSDCGAERIPAALLGAAFADRDALDSALDALADVSLIQLVCEDLEPRDVEVHAVVQMVGRHRSGETGAARDIPDKMVEALQASRPEDAYTNADSWPAWATLLPHFVHRLQATPDRRGSPRTLAKLCNEAGGYLFARGEYDQAEVLRSTALTLHLEHFGLYDLDTSASLNDVGLIKHYLAQPVAARRYLVCALRIRRRLLLPDDTNVIVSLNNLGLVYNGMKQHARAIRLHARCVELLEKKGRSERLRLATALSTLATAVRAQGDIQAAIVLTRRALDIRLEDLGEAQPPTGFSLHNLGVLLLQTGDLAGSAEFLMRALRLRRRVLGSRHPDTAWTVFTMGRLMQRANRYDRASRLCKRAYRATVARVGPDHPSSKTIEAELTDMIIRSGDEAGR